MSADTITSASGKIKITTGHGTKMEVDFPKRNGHEPLVEMLRECTRILAIAGLSNEARIAVEDTIKDVAEWRAKEGGA